MRYDRGRGQSAAMDFITAIMEFDQVLSTVEADRRVRPADDLVSSWVGADIGGCPLSHDTLINETGLVISGGAETTRTVIARSLVAFAETTSGTRWPAYPALSPLRRNR